MKTKTGITPPTLASCKTFSTKTILTAALVLLGIAATSQPDRATKIYNENAAADERRLQKLKDQSRTPARPGRSSGSFGNEGRC